MKHRRNTLGMAALSGAAILVLSACGASDASDSEEADGTLTIGTLLPETGSLAFFGPPMTAGVMLAIEEINAAGGVLGQTVVQHNTDSGDTSTNIAQQSVDSLLGQDVDAIIGAASSSVSLSVIDKITNAGVVQVSPSNTSTSFTTYEDNGLYFRTAPSDVLQGRVVGDQILSDGYGRVAIVALQDAYGETLAEQATKAITDGGGEVTTTIFYDPKASNFSAEITEAKQTNPDAVLLIAFDETKTIIPEAVKQNFGPSDVPYYFTDGNLSSYADVFEPGTLTGTRGTLPGNQAEQDFRKQLEDVYGPLKDYVYAGESYDAVVLLALGAEAAESDSGEAIAAELEGLSKGGTKCTNFEECRDLLADGEDIDYDGISGPVEWDDVGDPTAAYIGVYEYGKNNEYKPVDFRFGEL